MQSVSPVFTDAEVGMEREVTANGVIGLPVTLQIIDPKSFQIRELPNWAIAMRFRLNDEERAAVAAGADLVASQMVCGKAITPMNVQFCAPGEKPVFEPAPDGNPTADDLDAAVNQPGVNVIEFPESPDLKNSRLLAEANQTQQPAAAKDQPQSNGDGPIFSEGD